MDVRKRLEDYHFEYVKLKRKVNLLEAEVEDLNEYVEQDECVDRKTVVDLIHEIVPSLIGKKGQKALCIRALPIHSTLPKNLI